MFLRLAALAVVLVAPDEKEDLLAAAQRAAEAKSYAYRGETKLALPEGLAPPGGAAPLRFEGKVDRAVASWARTDAFEFVTAGGRTAARPISDWKIVRDEDASDIQRLLHQALAGARAIRAPHEDFAGYARAVEKVKKAEAKETIGGKECVVYEAELSEPAARDLARSLIPAGRWVDRLPDARGTASTKVWVDPDGLILKTESTVRIAASIQGREMELSATRTVEFSNYGATTVEFPDAVKKLLEAK